MKCVTKEIEIEFAGETRGGLVEGTSDPQVEGMILLIGCFESIFWVSSHCQKEEMGNSCKCLCEKNDARPISATCDHRENVHSYTLGQVNDIWHG